MGAFIHDLYRYKAYDDKPLWVHFFLQRCVWAIFQYRVSNAIYRSRIPRVLKSLLLKGCLLWKFFVELLTGISIRYGTTIGKGLYIGHTGNIRISAQAIIGEYCNISQGVTIGISGRGEYRGVPEIGNRVYIGTNAVVVGKIKIGNGAVVGANSLVTRDVAPNCTVVGVPAVKVSDYNSDDLIMNTK